MSKVKLIWFCVKVSVIAALIITVICLISKNHKLQDEVSFAATNFKALQAEHDSVLNQSLVYQFTIDQLNYYNDSITEKMREVKKKLKVKDKDLQNLGYLLSIASKTDTILVSDTIFVKGVALDTLIGDEWYNLNLGIKYPNEITTNVNFTSEKYIITSLKKETIDPPKKCWLARLFQKKHKVLTVEVVEKNPYIINKQQKFIEVIKK